MKNRLAVKVVGVLAGLALTLGIVFSAVSPVQAAVIDTGGNIAKDRVIDDDLFLSGQNVVMDGRVNGLLMAVGNDVVINGIVNGDVFVAGQTVTISETAQVDGNLFAAAQIVNVNGPVKGSIFGGSASMVLAKTASTPRNMFYGGFSLETAAGSTIGKDLHAGVYQAILSGSIGQDADVNAGAVELNGTIGRNAAFVVEKPGTDQVPPMMFFPGQKPMPATIKAGLRISPSAKIAGKLSYTSSVEQSSAIQAAPAGGVAFMTPVPDPNQKAPVQPISAPVKTFQAGLGMVGDLIALLLLGALALWLLPGLFGRVVEQAKAHPLPAAGYGFVTVLVGYAGAVVAAIVLILLAILVGVVTFGKLAFPLVGLGFSSLGLIMGVFTLLVGYGSKLVVAFLAGRWMVGKLSSQSGEHKVWPLVAGVVVYVLLRAIPVLGFLIGLAVTLVGVGAMWLVFRSTMKPAAPETPALKMI